MRGLTVSALLAVVFLAAGCGGGAGGSSSGRHQSGEATKPATQVVQDAAKAAEAARFVHMSGQITSSGKRVGLDLSLVRGKGATGTFTLHGAKFELVAIGNAAYLRGGRDFWNQFSQKSGVGQLLAGRWLKFPANSAQLTAFTGQANAEKFFHQLTVHGKLENRGTTTYKGQSVVAIYEPKKKSTLYVAASGAPYPVAYVKTKRATAGNLMFDRWNQSVTLKAPRGALDISKLSSG